VTQGETCERCGSTQRNVATALVTLEAALRPLGIQPVLETQAIDDATFRADPSASNRIWIAGRPLEEWLGARVGNSACCTVCGGLPCRTVVVDGATFEAIPEDLIVRAAMIAAAAMVGPAEPPAAPAACCTTGCKCD
jgi:hypothetical protein